MPEPSHRWIGHWILSATAGVGTMMLVPIFHMWADARGYRTVADVLCGVLGGGAAAYALRIGRLRDLSRTLTVDLAAHRAAADAVRAEGAKLRAITDAIPGALVQYGLDSEGHGQALFLNRRVEDIFGYGFEQLRENVMLAWDQVPREDLDAMLVERTRSARELTPWVQEFRVVRNGSQRWIRGEAVPERQADGSTLWHGILVDVTATKALEQTLREREESTRRLYEIAHSASLGFEGRIRAMLQILRLRFGSSVAAVSRSTNGGMELLFVDSEEPGLKEGLFFAGGETFCSAILQADGPIGCEHVGATEWRDHKAYRNSGMESFIGIRISTNHSAFGSVCLMAREPRVDPFSGADRESLQLVAMFIGAEMERQAATAAAAAAHQRLEERVADRTDELVSANARLRLSEGRLRHALAVGGMGIWERDLRGESTVYDERLREMLGIDAAVRDVRSSFMERLWPEDRVRIEELVYSAERGGADYVTECRYQHPAGRWIWLSVSGGPRMGAEGIPTHVAGTASDITHRKEAEAELQRLTEELDRRVVDRTRALDESRRRLRALVGELTRAEERERRRLAAELHDTLTQTLTLGSMNVARATRLLEEGAAAEHVVGLLAQARATLDSSIAYSRTLIGELSPRVLYDFGLPVALEWLGEQMRPHGLAVTVRGGRDGVALRDEQAVLLFQASRELLWNVVKHAEAPAATVTWHEEAGNFELAVEDLGRGFVDEGPTRGGGFGLLSIRERLALHGGTLMVRSTPGQGSRVTLHLPLAGTRDDEQGPVRPTQSDRAAPIRVMLVDDHSMVREGLCRVLEEHPSLSIVAQAGDGASAVDLARRYRPDVVIMDVNLPTIGGIEATRRILGDLPRTIVIGISSGADDYAINAMITAGAVACVVKERAVEDLLQVIDDTVAGRAGISSATGTREPFSAEH